MRLNRHYGEHEPNEDMKCLWHLWLENNPVRLAMHGNILLSHFNRFGYNWAKALRKRNNPQIRVRRKFLFIRWIRLKAARRLIWLNLESRRQHSVSQLYVATRAKPTSK